MLDSLYRRRSIRKYQSTKIDQDTVQLLLKAALLSPSSKGLQPWQFIVVEDSEILKELSKVKKGAGHLKNATLGIVVCADSAISDVWVEDASIAATILHLTANSMGLGSCWIQIRERQFTETETAEQHVREVLEIPVNIKVVAIISIGYPDESKSPHTDNNLRFDKVHLNKYGLTY
ncbi:nitroreductase family protein [Desulfosporosinus sp. Sb-LF]|uniref:nitroreductase family protein n=1 Tax=Desulfosporosinus sp. Sb-LF TaxID=2560027 RepID=UPI00107F7CB7|nr:nitroreductase family protein [Desulfosporosinus sp. Sb-LF]TGE33554.1 NAD(P)H nitroreductase [Desulfosporosinus sp. Sb-LF]